MPVKATVTVTPAVSVQATTSARCLAGKAVISVAVSNTGDSSAAATITTVYGSKVLTVGAGKSASAAFTTRLGAMPSGTATVSVTQAGATANLTAPYGTLACG